MISTSGIYPSSLFLIWCPVSSYSSLLLSPHLLHLFSVSLFSHHESRITAFSVHCDSAACLAVPLPIMCPQTHQFCLVYCHSSPKILLKNHSSGLSIRTLILKLTDFVFVSPKGMFSSRIETLY